jgi:hypothetical protein
MVARLRGVNPVHALKMLVQRSSGQSGDWEVLEDMLES